MNACHTHSGERYKQQLAREAGGRPEASQAALIHSGQDSRRHLLGLWLWPGYHHPDLTPAPSSRPPGGPGPLFPERVWSGPLDADLRCTSQGGRPWLCCARTEVQSQELGVLGRRRAPGQLSVHLGFYTLGVGVGEGGLQAPLPSQGPQLPSTWRSAPGASQAARESLSFVSKQRHREGGSGCCLCSSPVVPSGAHAHRGQLDG